MAISEFVDGTTPLDASHLNAIVGGVNDNADAISELQGNPVIVPIYVEEVVSSTSDFAYTGVSFTIPANSVFVVSAVTFFNYVSAKSVGISTSSDLWRASSAMAYGETPYETGHARTVFCCRVTRSTTYYVWGSWQANNMDSTVYVYGFYFNY